ncbi:MAG TPA: SAM-dependent methyltransferase [Thermoanaerobaculia bacterium]|nr:SAM-dependent methyltransferase [Thermoanaerobaculia bacterium]
MLVDPAHPTPDGRPKLGRAVVWHSPDSGEPGWLVNHYAPAADRCRRVEPGELELLERCDGRRTLREVAAELRMPLEELLVQLEAWAGRAPGMLRFLGALELEERRKRHALAAFELAGQQLALSAEMPDLGHYHQREILEAFEQFERVETTVSHAFRVPHPALGGRSYGEALFDALRQRGWFREGGRMLEVGGGTGLLARHLLDRCRALAPEVYRELRYLAVDLSPALQISQRRYLVSHENRVAALRADVEELELAASKVSFTIANEMIADLQVAPVEGAHLRVGQPETEAERLALAYELPLEGAPERFLLNVGAIRLVEKLSRWLAKGGRAVLTEHGGPLLYPEAVPLPGHREHSIHFGHLETAARKLGLEAEVVNLGELLGADRQVRVIDSASLNLLSNHLLPALGRSPLPSLAYTREMLEAALGESLERYGNLRFSRLEAGGFLSPFGFWALCLRR